MPTFVINGNAVNLLITLVTRRRGERSRVARQWVTEPCRAALYRIDPKDSDRPIEEPFDIELDDDTFSNLREILAEELMHVDSRLLAPDEEFGFGNIVAIMEANHARDIRAIAGALGISYSER